jgi:hypothetical protein
VKNFEILGIQFLIKMTYICCYAVFSSSGCQIKINVAGKSAENALKIHFTKQLKKIRLKQRCKNALYTIACALMHVWALR